jgi:hypothetical protein
MKPATTTTTSMSRASAVSLSRARTTTCESSRTTSSRQFSKIKINICLYSDAKFGFFHANLRNFTRFCVNSQKKITIFLKFTRKSVNLQFFTHFHKIFFLPVWTTKTLKLASHGLFHKKSFMFPMRGGYMDCFRFERFFVGILKTAKKLNFANQFIEFIESLCTISRLFLRSSDSGTWGTLFLTKKVPTNFTQRLNKFN